MALAKSEVFGDVDIDMIAGPSEIAVLADETANPVKWRLIFCLKRNTIRGRAAVLVTPSEELAEAVAEEVEATCNITRKAKLLRASIRDYGTIYVTCNFG